MATPEMGAQPMAIELIEILMTMSSTAKEEKWLFASISCASTQIGLGRGEMGVAQGRRDPQLGAT